MKSMNRILTVLGLTLGLSAAALADDTDIYLDPLVPSGAKPLVMFYIDFRQNLNGPGCGDDGLDPKCDTLKNDGYLSSVVPPVPTKFDVLRAVLKKVLGAVTGVKVGFMMPHNQSNSGFSVPGPTKFEGKSEKSNGGFIPVGFGDVDDATHMQRFHDTLDQLPTPSNNNTAHDTQLTETYFEFYRYLKGGGVVNAHNVGEDNTAAEGGSLLRSDNAIEGDKGLYLSPLLSSCAKIFTVAITDGKIGKDDDSNHLIDDPISNGGMGLDLSNSKGDAAFSKVLAFLKDADLDPNLDGKQNVLSYFFVSGSALNPQGTDWANAGGSGTPYNLDDPPDETVEALTNIFKSILAVSTTFVAPSVPVNVFNRAQTVNEVFLALFEADENGLPRWNGNLKKVVIAPNPLSGNLELQDVNGDPAIDVDGRLRRDAVTFWTDTTTLPPPSDDEVAGADGRAITRGGAGQQIPGVASGNPEPGNDPGGRKIFTENLGNVFPDGNTSDELMPVEVTAANLDEVWLDLTARWDPAPSTTSFSTATTTEQNQALDEYCFLRGLEVDCATPRPWMMADPLHSRPRPVNYGARGSHTTANPDIRILIGTNEGFMRMIRNTNADGTQSGDESWAFIPRAAMGITHRLQQNVAGDPKHPNATDGSPVLFTKDADNSGTIGDDAGDQVLAFFGMRRGGRNLYALDITDPDNPKFKWRIVGGSGDFAELTQTWSAPQVGKVRLNGVLTDVLVFGGGYNGDDDGTISYSECDGIVALTDNNAYDDQDGVDEDDRTECFDSLGKDLANRITRHNKANTIDVADQVGADDPHGNALYIVDAQTGALIWKATDGVTAGFNVSTSTLTVPAMVDSIPADVTAVDTSGNGILDRIYAADTGGRVWRIDLAAFVDDDNDSTTPDVLVTDDKSVWTAMQLFNVGRHFSNTVADDRRFFNRVDVSQSRDDVGPFDAVLIGSGDREDPLGTGTQNWFYLVKDRAIVSGQPPSVTLTHDDVADLSSNCLQTGTIASCGIDQNLFNNGWKIQLNAATGEKNLAASVTAGGNVFFSTFAPEPVASACGLSEGVGRFYAIALQDATAIINFDTTNDSGGTTYERSDTLGSGGIPVEVVPLGGGLVLVQGQEVGENIVTTGGKTGFRTYWHEMTDL